MSTIDYTITVYCEGKPWIDEHGQLQPEHESYVVVPYCRLRKENLPDGYDWLPARSWVDASGKLKHPRAHRNHYLRRDQTEIEQLLGVRASSQFEWSCSECGFNEQRNSENVPLRSIFDRLAAAGRGEIEVRNLISLAWG